MTNIATSRPLRKDAARNRELLLAAAREVFAERGLDASLDDIARRAGLGVGTAYRHFPNKVELAQAVFAQAIDQIVDLAQRCAGAEDAWAGIVAFLEGAAAAQTADRGLREVLAGLHDRKGIEEINDRLATPLADLVERAKADGVLRACVDSTDIGVVVMMLCTVTDITGDVEPDLWRRYLQLLLAGLRDDGAAHIDQPPISSADLRNAMSAHKTKLHRRGALPPLPAETAGP